MKLALQNNRWGVWGLGVVGRSAISFLHKQKVYAIQVMDKNRPSPEQEAFLQAHNVSFVDEHKRATFFNQHRYIIPSPGISLAAIDYAGMWVPELDIMAHYFYKPIIAITGSVGKTSVTHLLSSLLSRCGLRVAIAGNIGTPMLTLIDQQDTIDYAIIEVSSFQLAYTQHFAPQLAIWTNFYPNHLDWHSTIEHYFQSKYNIMRRQHADQAALLPFQLTSRINTMGSASNIYFFATNADMSNYYIENNYIMYHDMPLLPTKDLPNTTFLENWLICIAALHRLGHNIDIQLLQNATVEIPGHRLEYVGSIGTIDFYNDSKSTIAHATLAAVRTLNNRPIALFLGGLSKGIDRSFLFKELKESTVIQIYCFGQEAEPLCKFAQLYGLKTQSYANLDHAFAACMNEIPSQATVLFSPGGSSFDLFKNYQDRGEHFKQLVFHASTYMKM